MVSDLQTAGKGQTINIMFRNPDNSPNILSLSSTPEGVVNAAQLAAIQSVVDGLKTALGAYTTAYAPVQTANENFKTVQATFETLATTAATASTALKDARENSPDFVAAKTALTGARTEPGYIAAKSAYVGNNVSENIAELTQARGAYVVATNG
jgi:citrate lyase beta subunit